MSPAPPIQAAAEPKVLYQRSGRARRYRLTLRHDGVAIATVPVRGSQPEAEAFVASQADWLRRARARQLRRPRTATVWTTGTTVMWRGELTAIRVADAGEAGRPAAISLAADVFRVPTLTGDLRPTLEHHFLRCAKVELPARTWELAAEVGANLKTVSVRSQRSRWGSCSVRGTVSLNWRLVQTPDFVRDYIIYHELAHLREMNHSDRFWAVVGQMCPRWREAERWLKQHGSLIGLRD